MPLQGRCVLVTGLVSLLLGSPFAKTFEDDVTVLDSGDDPDFWPRALQGPSGGPSDGPPDVPSGGPSGGPSDGPTTAPVMTTTPPELVRQAFNVTLAFNDASDLESFALELAAFRTTMIASLLDAAGLPASYADLVELSVLYTSTATYSYGTVIQADELRTHFSDATGVEEGDVSVDTTNGRRQLSEGRRLSGGRRLSTEAVVVVTTADASAIADIGSTMNNATALAIDGAEPTVTVAPSYAAVISVVVPTPAGTPPITAPPASAVEAAVLAATGVTVTAEVSDIVVTDADGTVVTAAPPSDGPSDDTTSTTTRRPIITSNDATRSCLLSAGTLMAVLLFCQH